MIREGSAVEWSWGNGTATGTVIVQEDGGTVLKLRSEVDRA